MVKSFKISPLSLKTIKSKFLCIIDIYVRPFITTFNDVSLMFEFGQVDFRDFTDESFNVVASFSLRWQKVPNLGGLMKK